MNPLFCSALANMFPDEMGKYDFPILCIIVLTVAAYFLWNKIVNEKNTAAAVIIGAIMIVVAILSLRGCH
jgi:membrane-bound ClpP family serine protease